MIWRVYRLPGSRQWWHIDSGPETKLINVNSIEFGLTGAYSVDMPDQFQPRAWFELDRAKFDLLLFGQGHFTVDRFIDNERSCHTAA